MANRQALNPMGILDAPTDTLLEFWTEAVQIGSRRAL